MSKCEVQEVQGLYGPFSLSERVLQKIWLKGQFDTSDLRTESGRSLRVIDPGRWNHLEGPDFLEAQLELEGRSIVGDVEVHFNVLDWDLHGHETNPNFNDVCLHVVLYPEAGSRKHIVTQKGTEPDLLYLLPLLERDLEDYAIDDALLELEQVEDAQWMLDFMVRPLEERRAILRTGALARWAQKLEFAGKRLAEYSWAEACHQYCLEVLGYSRNRAPMSRIALKYGIADFSEGRGTATELFEQERGAWRLNGLRPANHPQRRLEQYVEICRAHADWPERLAKVFEVFRDSDPSLSGAVFRKAHELPKLLETISEEVFNGVLSAKRLNTLICDGLLPLAHAAGLADAEAFWLNWPAGDGPVALQRFLKQAEMIDRAEPYSNGQLQGGLHLALNR